MPVSCPHPHQQRQWIWDQYQREEQEEVSGELESITSDSEKDSADSVTGTTETGTK